mgnify:FL=1
MADPAEADIIIINTCGFIESAKTEAIENILMACQYKQENPDLKVIVTGCLAERYKQQIIQEIPEVDAVVGIGSNAALPPSSAASVPTVRARSRITAPRAICSSAVRALSRPRGTMRT